MIRPEEKKASLLVFYNFSSCRLFDPPSSIFSAFIVSSSCFNLFTAEISTSTSILRSTSNIFIFLRSMDDDDGVVVVSCKEFVVTSKRILGMRLQQKSSRLTSLLLVYSSSAYLYYSMSWTRYLRTAKWIKRREGKGTGREWTQHTKTWTWRILLFY